MRTKALATPRLNRGIATLVILVLVGLAATAAVLGGLRFLAGSQSQTTTFHAQTQAQMRAWSGVDMLAQYFTRLESITPTPVFADLISALEAARSNNSNLLQDAANLVARVQNVQTTGSSADITINVTGRSAVGTRAEASATVQVVFAVTEIAGNGPATETCSLVCNSVAIDLVGNFSASGDIKFFTAQDAPYQIRVDGNVSLGGISTGGIDKILSTKSIRFAGGSATNFDEMHATCDIEIRNAGGFTVRDVKATRNVCLIDTVNSGTVNANGSIFVRGGTHGNLYAHANKPAGLAQCSSGADTLCNTSPTVGWPYDSFANDPGVRTGPTPTINDIYSRNSVHFNSSFTARRVSAEGDLRITGCSPTWQNAIFGGVFTNNNSCSRTATQYAGPWSFPVSAVSPIVLEHEVFDANTLRSAANYLYYRDSSNRTRVKVRGIQGIPDHTASSNPIEVQQNGYFYRTANIIDPTNPGWTNRTVAGYICINNNSPSRADELTPHCLAQLGRANNTSTFVPSFSNNKWTMNGVSHAPGIVFVEGNLDLAGGTYTNTFIATGNIHVTTAGGAVFALNYAGFNGVTASGNTALGVCNNTQYSIRPTDFCQGATYNHEALQGLGNYVLLAGSCPTSGCDKDANGKITGYIGGDVRVEKSVYGVIKAGNYMTTGGNAKIFGAISSLAQSSAVPTHVFGNSTEVHLWNPLVNDRYNPNNCSNQCTTTGGGGSSAIRAEVRWSRYL